jgi:imidazolonepropionase-like amidohydrolase
VIAFVDATVVPMDRAGALPHTTVIVRGDRIVAVGPTASVQVPAGARTIDARGKWLIPGLADMHVHTFDPRQLALFVTRGVTTVRILWGDPATIGARDAIKRGDRRLAPTIYTAGEIVDGDPPIWPGSIGVKTAAEATAVVERQHAAGYDYVKVYSLLPADAYDAIVQTAGKLGMPVIGHVPYSVGLGRALAAKQRSIEHLEGYARFVERDDSPVRDAKDFKARAGSYKYADEAKLADAIARTKAAGTFNCPTLVVFDRIAHLDHPDVTRPELAYVSRAQIAMWDPKMDFRFRNSTSDDFAIMRGRVEWGQTVVKRLVDAGAPVLAGTDVGNPWLVPGYSLHAELVLLAGAKLTPQQVLATATTNPARFFGATDAGAIATNARADLVLLDGDPLADIANTQKIAGVMLRGRWLPETELAAERDNIAAIYKDTRSRFAGVPAAAPDPIFTAQFRAEATGVSGEERVTVVRGKTILETRLDGEGESRWELELEGESPRGRSLHVVQDGLDVTVMRTNGRATVTGTLGASKVALTEPVESEEFLSGAPLDIDVAFEHTLVDLPIGESRTVKIAQLELHPAIALKHAVVEVTRQPDGTRVVAGATLPVAVYRVKAGNMSSDLALDAKGWPVETALNKRE